MHEEGDRLDPTERLVDVAEFDSWTAWGEKVCFWRTTKQTLCTHRNPLFNDEIGITQDTIAIDILHTLLLGVVQRWIIRLFWKLLTHDVFETEATTEDARIAVGLLFLRAELWTWYAARERECPKIKMSKLNNITEKMLGTKAKPLLKAKADESKWLLFFGMDMLVKYPMHSDPQSAPLKAAGSALVEYFRIMECNGRNFSDDTMHAFRAHCHAHLRYAKDAGILYTPKHHLMVHLTHRAAKHGNPRFYSTFLDESFNGQMAAVCRSAHRAKFQERVLIKFAFGFEGAEAYARAQWHTRANICQVIHFANMSQRPQVAKLACVIMVARYLGFHVVLISNVFWLSWRSRYFDSSGSMSLAGVDYSMVWRA